MGKAQDSRKRALAAEDYDSDGGFVEDAPKSKKSKNGVAKASVNYEMQKDDDGNEYWEVTLPSNIGPNQYILIETRSLANAVSRSPSSRATR